jgi:hypothetical protein
VDSEPTLILGFELLHGFASRFASQLLPPAGQYSLVLLHGITIYLLLIIPLPRSPSLSLSLSLSLRNTYAIIPIHAYYTNERNCFKYTIEIILEAFHAAWQVQVMYGTSYLI